VGNCRGRLDPKAARVRLSRVPKAKERKRPRGLTQYPMTTHEALRRMVSTPLPPGERRARPKRRKKRDPAAATKPAEEE
jgi:hypothetical protein